MYPNSMAVRIWQLLLPVLRVVGLDGCVDAHQRKRGPIPSASHTFGVLDSGVFLGATSNVLDVCPTFKYQVYVLNQGGTSRILHRDI